jgi:hypothetical protein
MTESDRARHDDYGPQAGHADAREAALPTIGWARGLELGLSVATSRFHATDIPNVPPKNLVQIGFGGWQAPRPGVAVSCERGTATMTVPNHVDMGINTEVTSLTATRVVRDSLVHAGRLPRRQAA